MKDVVRRFADPLAWLLLVYVALSFLIAVGHILFGNRFGSSLSGGSGYSEPLADRLLQETGTFLSLYVLLAVVSAVVAVTAFGVTAQARLVAFGALGLLAVGAVLGLVCAAGTLFVGSTTYYSARFKIEGLLENLVLLAIYAVLALIVLQLSANSALGAAPRQPTAAGYGGYAQGWPGQQGQQGQQGQGPAGPGQAGGSYGQPPWQQGAQPPPSAPPQQGGQPQQGGYGQPGQPPQQGGWPQQ